MDAIGSREAERGPGAEPGSWGATTGTCGAESEGLATGLLTESPVSSFEDSLSANILCIKGKAFQLPLLPYPYDDKNRH